MFKYSVRNHGEKFVFVISWPYGLRTIAFRAVEKIVFLHLDGTCVGKFLVIG